MVDFHVVISEKQRAALTDDAPTPLYHRLYSLLKSCILDGTLTEGMKMPTEQELAREFDVSRITSKRALDELAQDKLVERRRGSGTYVIHRHRPDPIHVPMVGLLQEIESLGAETRAIVLDCAHLHPPRDVRRALGLATGETALFLSRVRHHEGRRFGFYRSWTPDMDMPEDLAVFEKTPRMTYFRAQGLRARHMRQIITATAASVEAAEALEVEPGAPLLSLTRLLYAEQANKETAVDHLRVLYNPALFEYHIDLDIEGNA
ncbi:MAG: GntR family transcriptional regulator [Xanthomonadales bacterium]|nr:GntR family transcriptional regulator [Xanthomonadales bacterium]